MNRSSQRIALAAAVGGLAALLVACQSMAQKTALPPLALAPQVDIPRFMGTWYVIAVIPTFLEKDAHAATETYTRDADGSIDIDFRWRDGSLDGNPRSLGSRGFVQSPSGAVWGVQFVWPIKADYRVAYVAEDYSQTVIGREKRDYVWIMARTPTIPEADLQRHIAFAAAQGYDTSKLRRVPQR